MCVSCPCHQNHDQDSCLTPVQWRSKTRHLAASVASLHVLAHLSPTRMGNSPESSTRSGTSHMPYSTVLDTWSLGISPRRSVILWLWPFSCYSLSHRPKCFAQAYAFIQDFVFGNNQTGLLTTSGGATSVVGGVHTEYLKGILTGSSAVTGAFTTAGTYTWPLESWAAWDSYMATRTAEDVPVASATGDGVFTPRGLSGGTRSTAEPRRSAIGVVVLLGMTIALLGLF